MRKSDQEPANAAGAPAPPEHTEPAETFLGGLDLPMPEGPPSWQNLQLPDLPAFDELKVWGRVVGSPYAEDQEGLRTLFDRGRVYAQWFSEIVPEGEIGSMALEEVIEISAEEFSQAFNRGWS